MKTQASKRNIGMFFFKSREEQRTYASKAGKEKRDQGKGSPVGRRWAVVV